jgi:SAM-dependent methyltransferase
MATGEPEVERLAILNEIYGPSTENWLHRAGLREGMRIVEIGCGSGNTSCWLSQQVGETGSVLGIDHSAEQVEQARRQAERLGLSNITFLEADARDPGLEPGSFDLAYSRLVLMHLSRPLTALLAMKRLVKPGGVVACEELDLSRWVCDPPWPIMARCYALKLALGDLRRANFRIGTSLHRLFVDAGFGRVEVGAHFPQALYGRVKRLPGLSLRSFGPALIESLLVDPAELDEIVSGLLRLADDKTTLFGLPLMCQVWAIVP